MANEVKEKVTATEVKKAPEVKAPEAKKPFAVANYIRMTPSKVKRLLDVIRGKKCDEALAILDAAQYAASLPIKKVLLSAMANAENNFGYDKDNLIVSECYASSGPMFKRMMPRAKGRGDRILKKSTHITVVVSAAK